MTGCHAGSQRHEQRGVELEHDLRAVVRGGGSDDELACAIEAAVGTKWAGHHIGQVSFVRPPRSMSQIGG